MNSSANKNAKKIFGVKKALNYFYFFIGKIFKRNQANGFKTNGSLNVKQQNDLDKKLVYSLSKSRVPNWRQLKYIGRYLSGWERWLISLCSLIIIASLLLVGYKFYVNHLESVPAQGGEYAEALVGSPKYINSLYASVSDVDSDLSSLIFSSLFKRGPSGKIVNDLAISHEISPDNKSYTIKIRSGVKWHNGGNLTVDDIIFTFSAIKDLQYKSPLRQSFSGVEIEKIDDQTIKFVLSEPYAAFLQLLTFGILPQEIWQPIPANAASLAEINLKPIGSGPYKFSSLVRDRSGNIRSYSLINNQDYYKSLPYLKKIVFKFYANFEEAINALNNNLVDGISYLPKKLKPDIVAQDSLNFFQLYIPQLTAAFFNAKVIPALADKKVRQALAYGLDKNKIVSQVLEDNARIIDGPILPDSFAYFQDVKKYNYDIATATKLLDEAGWKLTEIKPEDLAKAELDLTNKDQAVKNLAEQKIKMGAGNWRMKGSNYLQLEIITIDSQEYTAMVEAIAKYWQQLNIKVNLNFIAASQIQTEIIRPRNFSVLFYSELVGGDPDPYAFWHSSQLSAAGLNIADYANKEVDQLLEEARLTSDINVRIEKYKKFQQIIAEDVPAIFFYSPTYTYVQSKEVKGYNVKNILLPADRFTNIIDWYVKTNKRLVW